MFTKCNSRHETNGNCLKCDNQLYTAQRQALHNTLAPICARTSAHIHACTFTLTQTLLNGNPHIWVKWFMKEILMINVTDRSSLT